MKRLLNLALTCMLPLLLWVVAAPTGAAVICVLNKQTGVVENKRGEPCPNGTAAGPRAVAPEASRAPAEDRRHWEVRLDDRSINGTLMRWAASASPVRQIAWELPREFIISASDSSNPFFGTFEEAVDRVLDSYAASDYPPKGCFYSNGVLRVVRRIDDGLECRR